MPAVVFARPRERRAEVRVFVGQQPDSNNKVTAVCGFRAQTGLLDAAPQGGMPCNACMATVSQFAPSIVDDQSDVVPAVLGSGSAEQREWHAIGLRGEREWHEVPERAYVGGLDSHDVVIAACGLPGWLIGST